MIFAADVVSRARAFLHARSPAAKTSNALKDGTGSATLCDSATEFSKRAYLEAVERRRVLKEKLKRWRGGGISTVEAARVLGILPGAVRKRWQAGRLIGWIEGRRIYLAKWQFHRRGLLPGVQDILRTFDSRDRWRVFLYFYSPQLSLRKKRPLDLLRAGEIRVIMNHAKLHGQDNTW